MFLILLRAAPHRKQARCTLDHAPKVKGGSAWAGEKNTEPQIGGGSGAPRLTWRLPLSRRSYLEMLLKRRGLVCSGKPGEEPAAGSRLVNIVTPAVTAARGCQLSLKVVPGAGAEPMTMHQLEEALDKLGVTTDAREPDIIRVSPAPIYNSYLDCHRFVEALAICLAAGPQPAAK